MTEQLAGPRSPVVRIVLQGLWVGAVRGFRSGPQPKPLRERHRPSVKLLAVPFLKAFVGSPAHPLRLGREFFQSKQLAGCRVQAPAGFLGLSHGSITGLRVL
jgi:hypothetical protein